MAGAGAFCRNARRRAVRRTSVRRTVRRQAEEARRHAACGRARCWSGWCRHPLLCAGALRVGGARDECRLPLRVAATDGRYDQIVGDEIPDRP